MTTNDIHIRPDDPTLQHISAICSEEKRRMEGKTELFYVISVMNDGDEAATFRVSETEAREGYGIENGITNVCRQLAEEILNGYIRELRVKK